MLSFVSPTSPDRTIMFYQRCLALDQNNEVQVMYVWLTGTGTTLRAKTKTLSFEPHTISDLPIWNYDGNSTDQMPIDNSDVYLQPVALFNDPFRGGINKLVLCDTYDHLKASTDSNTRYDCLRVMQQAKQFVPLFGLEQEYNMLDLDGQPLEWPVGGITCEGPYYCGVGTGSVVGRNLVEASYRCMLHAGLRISGTNPEVTLGQWEYQIGPCEGISAADQLWMSRFILHRCSEEFGIKISLKPLSIPGPWTEPLVHCNFSTKQMREPGGMKHIEAAVEKLRLNHDNDVVDYSPGPWNVAKCDRFSGVADRAAYIRIPRQCAADGFGYLEDRRPTCDSDPYCVTRRIVQTTCLD